MCGLHTHTWEGPAPAPQPGASPGPRCTVPRSADHLLQDLSRAGLATATPSGSSLSFRARSRSSRWSSHPLNQDLQSKRWRSVQSPPCLCFVPGGHRTRPPLTPRAQHHLHTKSGHRLESVTFMNRMADMLNLQCHLCRGATPRPPPHISTELPIPSPCCLSPPPATTSWNVGLITPTGRQRHCEAGPKLRPGSKLTPAGAKVPGLVPRASPACPRNVGMPPRPDLLLPGRGGRQDCP